MAKKSQEQLEKENKTLKEQLAAATQTTKVIKVELPQDVAQKYTLVNWTGSHRQSFGKYGVIDISTLTIDKADSLVKKGWPRLKAK